MKSLKTKILALLLSMMMVFGIAGPVFAGNLKSNSKVTQSVTSEELNKNILNIAKACKAAASNPKPSTYFGDWSIFAVNRGGDLTSSIPGLNSWNELYKQNVIKNISTLKTSTDYARTIIGLASIGVDTTKPIAGVNLFEQMLKDKDDFKGTYASIPISVLNAVNVSNYDLSNSTYVSSIDILIDDILSYLDKDGKFSYEYDGVTYIDYDSTAQAIQVLYKYKDKENVKEFIDKGLQILKEEQAKSQNGDVNYSACTTSQVIVALCTAGVDIETYKNSDGKTLYDGLMSYYDSKTHMFKGWDGNVDGMSTDQALYALIAYSKNINIYDLSGITFKPFDSVTLSLNTSSINIAQVGNTYQLKASVTPSNAVTTYKSSNTKIATVDSRGKIIAKGVGSTTITVNSVYGNKVSKSVKVNVKLGKLGTVKAAGGHKYAKISYSKVSGATKYVIYKYNGKSYAKYATTTKTSFTDKKVTSGKNYYYKVRAYNGGYYSGYSKAVKAAVKVGIPTKVKAKAGKKKVTVTFKKVKYAKKYEIYKKSDKKYKKIATVKKNKYVDKKVKKNKKYYYRVRAVKDSSNKSNFAKTVKSNKVK